MQQIQLIDSLKTKLKSGDAKTQIKELIKIVELKEIFKSLNTTKNLIDSKEKNLRIEKIGYEVIKKESNPKQLLFYSFFNIRDVKNKKNFFIMMHAISLKALYPYEDTKIVAVKVLDNAIDVIYEIFNREVGLIVPKRVVKKTYFELKKRIIQDNFLNSFLKESSNYENWILDYSLEDFLLKLVFEKFDQHRYNLLFEHFIELLKINLQIALI